MRTQIRNYVVSDDDAKLYRWIGIENVTCPADIRQAVAENPEGEDLIVEINSYGGNMFVGFEIYSVLREAACHTVAEIQSLSASAASTAMIGCDEVRASPVAQVMIHLPALATEGDENAHQRSRVALQSFKESILNAYELRCKGKKTRQELGRMMERETWMSVQDATAAGLVDTVLYDDDGVLAANVVNAVGSGFRALSCGLPPIEQVRTAWREAHPPEAKPNEAQKARLEAELELLRMM